MPKVPVGGALTGGGPRPALSMCDETADAEPRPFRLNCYANSSHLRFEDLQIGGQLLTLGFRPEIHRDHVHDE